MKILYVINSFEGGGGALPLPSIINVMRDAGHDVLVVALNKKDGRACRGLDGARIPYMIVSDGKRTYVKSLLTVSSIIEQEQPDLLWTSLSHATIMGQCLGKYHGIPVVSWLHNAWLKPENAMIMRRTMRFTRHWVADSGAAASFGQSVLRIPAERMSIWPIFRAPSQRQRAAAAGFNNFRLGSLGRLHRNKGYHVLLDAMSALQRRSPFTARRVSLTIAGEGAERGPLEKKVEKLGLANVSLPGFLCPEPFLASLNCYVQPSHHEGFCIAAHEAMCSALPVIASPVGEMAFSLERSKGGALVDYGDVDGLSRMIEYFANDPDRAALMGQMGRAWATEKFSPERFQASGHAALVNALR